MLVGRPVFDPIVPVTEGSETFRGPVIRQGFTSLRVRQGLRDGSGNLFDENHFGALKGSRFWCRYANCPQKGTRANEHVPARDREPIPLFESMEWLDGPGARDKG